MSFHIKHLSVHETLILLSICDNKRYRNSHFIQSFIQSVIRNIPHILLYLIFCSQLFVYYNFLRNKKSDKTNYLQISK